MPLTATCPLPDAAGGGPRCGRGGGVPRVVVGLLPLLLLLLLAGVAALAQLPQHAGPATLLLLHAALGVNSPASRVRRSSSLHVGQGAQLMQAGDWSLCIYVCSSDGGSSCALGCADQSSAAHRPRCVIRDGRMSLAFLQLEYVRQLLVAFWLMACRIV